MLLIILMGMVCKGGDGGGIASLMVAITVMVLVVELKVVWCDGVIMVVESTCRDVGGEDADYKWNVMVECHSCVGV